MQVQSELKKGRRDIAKTLKIIGEEKNKEHRTGFGIWSSDGRTKKNNFRKIISNKDYL